MARLDKSKMKCNAPRKSPKAGKKRVVKAQEAKKRSYTTELVDMVTTTLLQHARVLELGMDAVMQKIN